MLIAAAALGVFSLSGPAAVDGHEPHADTGAQRPGSTGGGAASSHVHVRGLAAVQISAGSDHVYALKADGTLVGWGFAGDGRLNTPRLLVQRGNDQDGDGWPDYQGNRGLVRQEPVEWEQVAAGNLHTCAVTTEGEVYCWGDNDLGQAEIPIGLLGDQFARWRETPNPRFVKIVAGGYHTCVLEWETTVTAASANGVDAIPAGSIVCWGDNSAGQINVPGAPSDAYGDPRPDDYRAGLGGVAADVNGDLGSANSSGKMYVDVTAGANHTCAIRTDGIVECWGSNSHGQIRVPRQLRSGGSAVISPSGYLLPSRSGQFHSIEAGENFTCALNREGGAVCWGSNNAGQEYPPAGEYSQISAGRWHACAIWTYDDPPHRAVPESPVPRWGPEGTTSPYRSSPEASEPATRLTGWDGRGPINEVISLSWSPNNMGMDCWGEDLGSGRTRPPTSVIRRTPKGEPVSIRPLQWNQVSAGGTFSCGIFDTTPGERDASVPSDAEAAAWVSATNTVSEGAVACWGLKPPAIVPAPDVIAVQGGKQQRISLDGWGRIYGRVSPNGEIEFAFKVVVQSGPDIWINPNFRFVPHHGNLTVGRWYYSNPMKVAVYTSAIRKMCRCADMTIGRIAVRLLTSGHMQLALMTPNGQVMANVPANHDRIPTPAEAGAWWATDFIKWWDAP